MTLAERFKALYDKIEGEKIRYDLNRRELEYLHHHLFNQININNNWKTIKAIKCIKNTISEKCF